MGFFQIVTLWPPFVEPEKNKKKVSNNLKMNLSNRDLKSKQPHDQPNKLTEKELQDKLYKIIVNNQHLVRILNFRISFRIKLHF